MCNSTLSHLPIECQTIPSCDAAATLREARADALRARAEACLREAASCLLWADACTDDDAAQRFLDMRAELQAEAERLEGGAA